MKSLICSKTYSSGGGFGIKLDTLGVETVVRVFPLLSLPYFATIDGVKVVPGGWELNAVRISSSVIRTLLFPCKTDVIGCVCVTWFGAVPVVTLSVRERNDEEKGIIVFVDANIISLSPFICGTPNPVAMS